jgi:hypothetical protein
MRRSLYALALSAALAAPCLVHAQSNEPNTGRRYMVPVAPGGGTNPPPVGATAPIAYTGSTFATAATTSGQLVAAGAFTKSLTLTNTGSTGNAWLNPACGTAVPGSGIELQPGGGFSFGGPSNPVPTGCINAISDSGSPINVAITGG